MSAVAPALLLPGFQLVMATSSLAPFDGTPAQFFGLVHRADELAPAVAIVLPVAPALVSVALVPVAALLVLAGLALLPQVGEPAAALPVLPCFSTSILSARVRFLDERRH